MAKDYSRLVSYARDWKPNTEYREGEYVWINKHLCQIVQDGFTGDDYSFYPGWGKGSIIFSGPNRSSELEPVRAIARQRFSDRLEDMRREWGS